MLGSLARRLAAVVKQRLLHRFTTHSTDEFRRFTEAPLGIGGPLVRGGPVLPDHSALYGGTTFRGLTMSRSLRPEDPRHCEELFASLHQQRRYEEMWALLAPEAQMSWGNRDSFINTQIRCDRARVVSHRINSVQILPEWTDPRRSKTYRNVAELKVRYQVKVDWREVALERDVHLIQHNGAWRTLCYAPEGQVIELRRSA
jgi:hypothetical protein